MQTVVLYEPNLLQTQPILTYISEKTINMS